MNAHARVIRAAVSILAGVVLVGLAFAAFPDLLTALLDGLAAFGPMWSLTILALTFSITCLTALKWRIVARGSVEVNRGSFFDYICFVSISAVAGLILPRQLSVIGSRAASLKHNRIADIPKGLHIVISDLMSDMVAPVALFAPSLLFVTGVISAAVAATTSVAILVFFVLTAPAWQLRFGVLLQRIGRWIHSRFQTVRESEEPVSARQSVTIQAPYTVFLLAVVKVVLIILRAWVVARAAGLPIGIGMLILAFPLVQFAFLVGITPAGLGIADWSWIGVLGAVGVPLETAAIFALLLRFANTASVVVVAAMIWVFRKTSGTGPSGPQPTDGG